MKSPLIFCIYIEESYGGRSIPAAVDTKHSLAPSMIKFIYTNPSRPHKSMSSFFLCAFIQYLFRFLYFANLLQQPTCLLVAMPLAQPQRFMSSRLRRRILWPVLTHFEHNADGLVEHPAPQQFRKQFGPDWSFCAARYSPSKP